MSIYRKVYFQSMGSCGTQSKKIKNNLIADLFLKVHIKTCSKCICI